MEKAYSSSYMAGGLSFLSFMPPTPEFNWSNVMAALNRLKVGSLLVLASLLFGLPGSALAGDEYSFDKNHSYVLVRYDHLGLAIQTFRFPDVDGTVTFDKGKPEETKAVIAVKTATLSSGDEGFDKKLRGKEYFNVEANPEITFKSDSAKRTGQNWGQITGAITINGVTKPVTFDVVYRYAGKHPLGGFIKKYKDYDVAGFSASTKLLRSEFGLGAFVPLVSDEVEIVIEMELLKKAE